jgi:phosphoadenosine phosphosulfate reductase
MKLQQIGRWNAELRSKSPLESARRAIAQACGRAVLSANFRPYVPAFEAARPDYNDFEI